MKVPIVDYGKHNKFLRNRKDKAIYLAINTNINCFYDWCPEEQGEVHYIEYKPTQVAMPLAGLYLGKIIFEPNKQGTLIPHYIPTSIDNAILEKEIEKINPLWLNEINKDYVEPIYEEERDYGRMFSIIYSQNIKLICKKTSEHITLSKEQVKSYFTELHTKNTAFIKNFIDSIHENKGLKGYYLNDRIYNQLTQLGILNQEKQHHYKERQLIALDYMMKTNQYRIIPHFDELFYPYLVWSLQEYTMLYFQGYLQEKHNLLFNPLAYYSNENIDTTYSNDKLSAIDYELWRSTLSQGLEQEIIDERKYCYSTLARNKYVYDCIFAIDASCYIPTDEEGAAIYCPNRVNSSQSIRVIGKLREYTEKIKRPALIPSALGNYYFELQDNRNTFLQFYPRIYPSIENPPKGWSKEMMQKLGLKLE